jgi:hypothetical protein
MTMATKEVSGLVTIQSKEGVLMKIVAGCGGQLAKGVAEALRVVWPVDASRAYEIACGVGLGCECPGKCLIVITESGIVLGGREEPMPDVYRETFQLPNFNSRQRDGTADFIEIVDVDVGAES